MVAEGVARRLRGGLKGPSLLAVLLASPLALALDKQGSAHGGSTEVDERGVNLTGALIAGVALYNPSYAARPDNTGLALMRYAGHLDLDLIGQHLSIPLDVNFFSDREGIGPVALLPTEFDVIAGVTSTWNIGIGALEGGLRVEHDRPIDRPGFTQTYVDARARYLFTLGDVSSKLRALVPSSFDVSGWLTLGCFLFNPTYAARPDNTGLALLRYAAHVELSALDDLLSVGFDFTGFTDRQVNAVALSELDLTCELIFHKAPFEVHLAYERDMPVDRRGLVQQFLYVVGVWSFDLIDSDRVPEAATTNKRPMASP